MTELNECPTCGTHRPANRTGTGPWCCSIACYRSFHDIDQPEAPSCHDSVTMTYPPASARSRRSVDSGNCCDAWRDAGRRDASQAPVVSLDG